jgi:hypothetical protein
MPRLVTSVRGALIAVALAAVLTACGGNDTAAADGTVAQVSGPSSFTGELLGGGQLEGSSLAGRAVLLWFWAPT